jgi:hypothetical protein
MPIVPYDPSEDDPEDEDLPDFDEVRDRIIRDPGRPVIPGA